jgi:hypothetical protein
MPANAFEIHPASPCHEVNRSTARNIRFYATHSTDLLNQRLKELDSEVALESVIHRSGGVLTIAGLIFFLIRGRRWWILPLAVTALQLQFSSTGRGPLVDFLRRRRFRSRREIEAEKLSLRALRGDFSIVKDLQDSVARARKCLELFL